MEPAGAVERLVPIDIARFGQGDGAIGAVVDHLGGALIGAGFQVVNAHAALAAHDAGGVHAEAAQFADRGIGDGVGVGQHGDVGGRQAELRHGDGDVRLAASEGGDELRTLHKALQARRREAEHDFTEGNDGFQHSGNDIVSEFADHHGGWCPLRICKASKIALTVTYYTVNSPVSVDN